MTSPFTAVLALACLAAVANAQATKTPAKPDSAKAPATKVETKQPVQAPATKVENKQAATPPVTKAGTQPVAPGTKAPQAATKAPAPAAAAPPQVRTPVIMREVYGYQQESRRDPFVTLLTSSDLRPTVADLRLTGILYDENGSNSIATMRDVVTDEQYRVTTGQTLGRMKVALIKRRSVIFSIEAFGLNRQDSLVLGDTTKARAK
jgi:hypothetical protein